MSVNRQIKMLFALVLIAVSVVIATQIGGRSVAAEASGQPSGLASDRGNPNAVPPILAPAGTSTLAELEAGGAFSVNPPSTGDYSWIARGVMLRLAGGEDGTLARRRVPLREMERVDGAGPVLASLTDARLLTVSDGEVELAHEALLREWPRYRAWLEEDRIGRRLHTHLTAAAVDWDGRDRDRAISIAGPGSRARLTGPRSMTISSTHSSAGSFRQAESRQSAQ